jgi:hypothetical protein
MERKLTGEKIDPTFVINMIKDKTPEEIGQIFGAVDDLNSKLLESD